MQEQLNSIYMFTCGLLVLLKKWHKMVWDK